MTNEKITNNQRIAKNTLFLYFRMLFNMVITLYTSRIVLNALGVEDFGIYNIVGGFVATFSLISGSLSDSVSRFLSIELGKNDTQNFKNIFITSINIHIILALIVLVSAETIGLWFLNQRMNIPNEKIIPANWVFQFSVFTFLINLLSVPYNASIISNEKMGVYAYVSIFEVTCKLIVATFLTYFSNRLIAYSVMLFMIAAMLQIIYVSYCKRMLSACTFNRYWNTKIMKSMIGFASWNFLGNIANVFKSQGVSILVNLFFNVTINAAQGVAVQVSNAVEQFSSNFLKALTPQLIKTYAIQDKVRVIKLSSAGTRFSFYLLTILIVPIYFGVDEILSIWLVKVPEWANIFVRIILVSMLIEVLSKTLITIIQASGYVKKYQIGISFIIFMNFPLSYIVLRNGGSPASIYYVQLVIYVFCLGWRLYIVKGLMDFSLLDYVKSTYVKPVFLLVVSVFTYLVFLILLKNIVSYFIGFILSLSFVYFIGLKERERIFVKNFITRKIKDDRNKR